jgi:hypothetical protein
LVLAALVAILGALAALVFMWWLSDRNLLGFRF